MTTSSTSPFERLSPELHLEIFRLVLKHDAPLAPAYLNERINISPLLLNRTLHREALDAFYEVNMIRLHYPEQWQGISPCGGANLKLLVRRLELVNPKDNWVWLYYFRRFLMGVFKRCKKMKKLISVTIACDELAQEFGSTRRWLGLWLGMHDVQCVDIGHFQFGGDFSFVHVKHMRLVHRWQNLKQDPEKWDMDDFTSSLDIDPSSVGEMTTLNLKNWIYMHDVCELVLNNVIEHDLAYFNVIFPSGQTTTVGLDYIRTFIKNTVWTEFLLAMDVMGSPYRQYGAEDIPESIAELGLESDQETLEWATELMALNVAFDREFIERIIRNREWRMFDIEQGL